MSLRNHARSLTILHAADVLQPLLILPYAGRVLGPLEFGQFAYAIAIGQLAATIVDYGFHWTGQRAAASARGEPAVIAALFAEVVVTKALLCLVVTVGGLVATNGLLAMNKALFLSAMLTSFGNILFPAWLFIALERAWQAAFAVVVSRILAIALFLMIVTSPAQLELAVAIQSGIPLASAIIGLPFVVAIGLGGFRSVTMSGIGMQLRGGWRGFLYTLVERALMTLPVPFIQHFGGYVAAGQYSVAEKFVGATRPFFRVMSETFLPRVAYYAQHDPAAGVNLIRTSLLSLVVGAALGLTLFFAAPYVIVILFGHEFSDAIPIVRVMSVLPVLMNANICTSTLYMFNYGHERAWAFLTVAGLLTFVALAYLLCLYLPNAAIAVALAIIARESVVLVVSGGFFLAYSAAKMRASPAHSVGNARPDDIADSAMLTPQAHRVAPRHDRVRTER